MRKTALIAIVLMIAAGPAYAQTTSPSPGGPTPPATDPAVAVVGVITILLVLGAGLFIYRVIRKGL